MIRSRSTLASFSREFLTWDISLQDTDNAFTMFEEHEGPVKRENKSEQDVLNIHRHDTPDAILNDQLEYLMGRAPDRIADSRKVVRDLIDQNAEGIIHVPDLLEYNLDIDVHTRRVLLRMTTVIPLLAYMQDHFLAEYLKLLKEAYTSQEAVQPSLEELVARHTTTWIADMTEREVNRLLTQDKPRSIPPKRRKVTKAHL